MTAPADAAGLLRALRDEVAATGMLLDDETIDRDARIHRVRRATKRARTLVRLLRPVLETSAEPLAAALRASAGALAGARDAKVVADAAETLREQAADPDARQVFAAIAARAHADERGSADLSRAREHLDNATAILRAVSPPASNADAAIAERIATLYRRARKGLDAARAAPRTEALHEWRKRVKDRLHLAKLAKSRWPERAPARPARLEKLADVLGRDHDLAMLAAAIPRSGAGTGKARALVRLRRSRLAEKALDLGDMLFAEKPARVRRAWRGAATR